ncbi:MAG: NAD(P)H-dependent oxidoreductase [Lachnospiraceae bacterium]|nr:NAD(P)H-dependent oxidoreductase [Lachnospiraceae bacterium]
MKRIVMALLMAAMVISLTACGGNAGQGGNPASDTVDREQSPVPTGEMESASIQQETDGTTEPSGNANLTDTDAADILDVSEEEGSKVLVAYFSATGTTQGVAEIIAENMEADIYEIVPREPYTDADLNWHDDKSRSTIEMNDSSSRPEIDGAVEDMEQYDIVFIGYPIWWGEAPRIVSTFMESYSFEGKTVIPFCTSSSSGLGSSGKNLEKLTDGAQWLEGMRFGGGASEADVQAWIEGLGL